MLMVKIDNCLYGAACEFGLEIRFVSFAIVRTEDLSKVCLYIVCVCVCDAEQVCIINT